MGTQVGWGSANNSQASWTVPLNNPNSTVVASTCLSEVEGDVRAAVTWIDSYTASGSTKQLANPDGNPEEGIGYPPTFAATNVTTVTFVLLTAGSASAAFTINYD